MPAEVTEHPNSGASQPHKIPAARSRRVNRRELTDNRDFGGRCWSESPSKRTIHPETVFEIPEVSKTGVRTPCRTPQLPSSTAVYVGMLVPNPIQHLLWPLRAVRTRGRRGSPQETSVFGQRKCRELSSKNEALTIGCIVGILRKHVEGDPWRRR